MKSSVIQIIVTSIFIFFAVVGVVVFSVSSTKNSKESQSVRVSVWGVLPKDAIVPVIEKINLEKPGSINMNYEYIESGDEMEKRLIDALLDNKEIPDGLIIPQDLLLKFRDRLANISWTAVSQRDLQNTFSDAQEVFFTDTGTYAIPFLIDPLVLYWNRDIFNSNLITTPPQTWEDLTTIVPTLTERNTNKTLKKTAIALGEYANILHTKEIISALSLQVGGKFVSVEKDSVVSKILDTNQTMEKNPLEVAVSFFTQFADPSASLFTWSRALPDSLLMFLRGDSAMYIGFGSEASEIRSKNPNLNFDIATLPQVKDVPKKTTFAKVYGIAIPQEAVYKEAVLNTAFILTSAEFQKGFSAKSNFAPVRRDLLATPPGTGVLDVVYKSALWSTSWLDPAPQATSVLFKEMIEGITGGKRNVSDAVVLFAEEFKQTLDAFK